MRLFFLLFLAIFFLFLVGCTQAEPSNADSKEIDNSEPEQDSQIITSEPETGLSKELNEEIVAESNQATEPILSDEQVLAQTGEDFSDELNQSLEDLDAVRVLN